MPPYQEGCAPDFRQEHNLAILFPREASEVYIPVDFSGNRSKVVFRATHRDPSMRLFWYLDNSYLGTTQKLPRARIKSRTGFPSVNSLGHFRRVYEQETFGYLKPPKF